MLLQLSFLLQVIPILSMFIKWNNCISADQAIVSKVEPSPRTIGVEKTTNSNLLVWCWSNSYLRTSIHRTEVEKTIFSEWRLEKLRRRSSRSSLRWSGPLDFGVEKPRRRSSRSSLHRSTVTLGKSRSHILFGFFLLPTYFSSI